MCNPERRLAGPEAYLERHERSPEPFAGTQNLALGSRILASRSIGRA
jgi:hypothetical protein